MLLGPTLPHGSIDSLRSEDFVGHFSAQHREAELLAFAIETSVAEVEMAASAREPYLVVVPSRVGHEITLRRP
jgi:hypothetical protein